MLASLKQALKQFSCAHARLKHLDTARIHAEAVGFVGTQIDYFECEDCKKSIAKSSPLPNAADA